jgi:hypothetical protein
MPALRDAAEAGAGRLYFPVNIHWTAAGHAVAAREVARFLLSSGLLN